MTANRFRIALSSLALLALILGACASWRKNPWAKFTTPVPGPAESIGSYSVGCLKGAAPLIEKPENHIIIMRPQRARAWGHPVLVSTLLKLAQEYDKKKLGILALSDMGMVRGGPMPSGHRSHQIGLDADVWFDLPTNPETIYPLPALERENIQPRRLVSHDGADVDPLVWKQGISKRLEIAAKLPEVSRIFVNPAVKQKLCKELGKKKSAVEWLRKLRPWWGHDYHFHMRLNCLPEDAQCKDTQDPIPPGNGCDDTLAWWFSEEAHKSAATQGAVPSTFDYDKMPEACKPLLDEPDTAIVPITSPGSSPQST